MNTVVIDNGGYTIKCGLASNKTPSVIAPNCTAKYKGQIQLLVADQTSTVVGDASQLTYYRPFDRGYLVNWNCEIDVWERMFSKQFLNVKPNSSSLLVTSPLLNPTQLQTTMDEVIFEDFGYASYCRVSPAEMAALGYSLQDTTFGASSCQLIVDSGFSFTHVVPLVNSKPILSAVRRLNVGGKLLTNYLKEIVSFRQWNMMDESALINEVKEALCYCSLDFMNELRDAGRINGTRQSILKEWVLPDYQQTNKGFIKDDMEPLGNAQILQMNLERIAVPEVLFHPSDIGINQAGIAEVIVQSVEACPLEYQGLFYENVLVVGGNTKFPNFIERLKRDLRPMVPSMFNLKISHADDPITCTWQGAASHAQHENYNHNVVTKQEYDEHGSNICNERFSC